MQDFFKSMHRIVNFYADALMRIGNSILNAFKAAVCNFSTSSDTKYNCHVYKQASQTLLRHPDSSTPNLIALAETEVDMSGYFNKQNILKAHK